MTIFINGEARELDSALNISTLLDRLSLPKKRIAIELNRQVVRRQDWENTRVHHKDKIEVVHFVGGG